MRVQLFKDINVIYQADQRLSFYDVIQHVWEGKAEIVQWDGETVVIREKPTPETDLDHQIANQENQDD